MIRKLDSQALKKSRNQRHLSGVSRVKCLPLGRGTIHLPFVWMERQAEWREHAMNIITFMQSPNTGWVRNGICVWKEELFHTILSIEYNLYSKHFMS